MLSKFIRILNKSYFFHLILLLITIYISQTPVKDFIKLNNNKILVTTSFNSYNYPDYKKIHEEQLANLLDQDVADHPELTFGIVVKELNSGEAYYTNENKVMVSASLYKLAVMYTIFKMADEGKIDINKPDIQKNLKAMITVSSNEAALALVYNYTGWDRVTENMKALGLTNSYFKNTTLLTTPADIAKLLELIAAGNAVNTDSSVKMLDLMSQQQRRDRIPALLPDDVLVANKTGEIDDKLLVAGIVASEDHKYVIVIMTEGSATWSKTKPIMAKISKDVYDFFESETPGNY